jgi:hypothetical protein
MILQQGYVFCSGCGQVISGSLEYCSNCGKKLIKATTEENTVSNVSPTNEDSVICVGCGKQMQGSLEYCSNCGKKLSKATTEGPASEGTRSNENTPPKQFPSQEKGSSRLRADLLEKLDVYAEAMHFMTTFARFDAAKFEILDDILSKADGSFGPEKRREMLTQAQYILPTKTTGGTEELRVILAENLAKSFTLFNELLYKISPTPETAMAVKQIVNKYKAQ